MSHRLSLSRYALAQLCSWWARPDVDFVEPPPGERARVGNVTHAVTHAYVTRGETSIPLGEYSPREMAEGLSIFHGPLRGWLDAWKSEDVARESEIRLRIDTETGRVHETPRRGEPGYSRPGPTEVTGELDLVKNYGTWGRIEDLKTGQKRYTDEAQLRSYGVIAASYFGWSRVEVAFLYARKTKVFVTPYVTLDENDLDAEHGLLRRTLRLLPTAEPQPGAHCWRCPAKDMCPARHEGRADATMHELEAAGFF